MKKSLCILLSFVLITMLCGCETQNNESANLSQKVTIVKMPSPPKCKTTDNISIVNDVINTLGMIDKSPIESDNVNGGWNIMVKLEIDGKSFNYTIGGVFTDSDGKQYYVNNLDYIEEKLNDIYEKINAPEVDYP